MHIISSTGHFFYLRHTTFGSYEQGVVAGAYVGLLHWNSRRIILWGFGGVANSETLLAHGLCHAHDFLCTEQEGDAEPKIQAWVRNRGLNTYLTKHVPKWISNGGLTSDGKVPSDFDLWTQLYLRKRTSQLYIDRPEGRDATAIFARLDRRSAELAQQAHRAEAFKVRGLAEQGEEDL